MNYFRHSVFTLFLLVFCNFNCFAESGCKAIIFGSDLPTHNGASNLSINDNQIPGYSNNIVYVVTGLKKENYVQISDGYGLDESYYFSCNNNSMASIEFNKFKNKIVSIDTERAVEKLKKYKKVMFYKPVDGRYDLSKQILLIDSNSFKDDYYGTGIANKGQKSFKLVRPFNLKTEGPINRNAVAVIIGNKNYSNNYSDVPNVDYAHNDADAMYDHVIKTLGFREGNVIFLKDATQADLMSTFGNKENHKGKLYSWVRPQKSDVFVFYSGHGAPGISNGQGYLLPVNADPMTVELNGYPLETLYKNLAMVPAKTMTVVLDACFSGASPNGSVVKSASSIALKRIETETTIPEATLLTASDVDEIASWDEGAKMGLFTKYFLEGVTGAADGDAFGNGDGRVTLGELKGYLESEVTYMARRYFMRDQHPQVIGKPEKVLAVLN